jgi:hypothetical protein
MGNEEGCRRDRRRASVRYRGLNRGRLIAFLRAPRLSHDQISHLLSRLPDAIAVKSPVIVNYLSRAALGKWIQPQERAFQEAARSGARRPRDRQPSLSLGLDSTSASSSARKDRPYGNICSGEAPLPTRIRHCPPFRTSSVGTKRARVLTDHGLPKCRAVAARCAGIRRSGGVPSARCSGMPR